MAMKLLSPAGNFESLKMAVYNGANEVYLGINDFNARNNINGFTLKSLKEAIDFAHIYNVKVLLAINILFSDSELQSALDTLVESYNIGVDAFIIQDLALAHLVHTLYPEIEIHASTQMGIHNLEGVLALKDFGFSRIVLARETPLEEIRRIKENSSVEIEYFCQGALCVSFSGNCYLSSYLHDASGNRGKCKQLCRLPYTLEKNGKKLAQGYLLSAKDFNMINNLNDLEKAGVDVLKIEGRARRPEYVGIVTKEYFAALNKNKPNTKNIELAFNREYTAGYFNGNGNIISPYQNHIGTKVGEVKKVNAGRKFNEVFFSSSRPLSSKSTFKFFYKGEEQNTLTAFDLQEVSKGTYRLTTTQDVKSGSVVHLILDYSLEQSVLNTKVKRTIDIELSVQENKPIQAIVKINKKTIKIFGECLEKAQKQPLTQKDFIDSFMKNEHFVPTIKFSSFESVFMPKQQLNEFRRKVYSELISLLTAINHKQEKKSTIKTNHKIDKFENFVFVENINENFNAKNIIYSPENYTLEDVKNFISKCEKLNKKPYLDTPNFALKEDIKLLETIIEKTKISIVANNYYALSFKTDIVVGAGLNVYNSLTAKILNKPVITAESDISTRIDFPYMTLRHCPFKSHLKASCSNCPYSEGYTYKMDSGKILKLKRKKLSTCTFYLY